MKDMQENHRLTHLLIPRIMITNAISISDTQKSALLMDYYSGIKNTIQEPYGNMIFIGEKDEQVYVDALRKDYVETRGLNHIILEARGKNINKAAEVVKLFITQNKPNWFLTRTDFCLHTFEENSVPKIWLEISYVESDLLQKYLKQEEQTTKFLNGLMKLSKHSICSQLRERDERVTLYSAMTDDISKGGFALLIAQNDYISEAVRLSSVFRNFNPEYDYGCDLIFNGSMSIVIIFSNKEIRSLYDQRLIQ